MANADKESVEKFSRNAADYSVIGAQGSFGGSCVAYSVVLTANVYEETASWIRSYRPSRRFAASEIPVIVDTSINQILLNKKTPIWGAAYYSGSIKFIESMLTLY